MQQNVTFFSSRKKLFVTGLLLLLIAGISGWFFTRFVEQTGDNIERARIAALANTAAASLNAEQVAALQGGASDTGTPGLESLRAQLKRMRDVNSDFRFIYLMRPKADDTDKLIFLADAEPESSQDYSAPGDVYDGPSATLLGVFHSGQSAIEDPTRDRWGYWLTSVAPVKDATTGKVVAVLGMDINADSWLAAKARYRHFAITIAALLTTLVLLFLLGLHLQEKASLRLAAQVAELKEAHEALRLADVVFNNTGEGIIVLDAEMKIQSVNPGFQKITGHLAAEVAGMNPQFLEASELNADIFLQIHSSLYSSDHWEGTLWAKRKNGETFPMETEVDVVRGQAGEVLHHVILFHDVTVQKQLEDRLRQLSSTDGLTLLANRRTFDEFLEREWNRAMRNHQPVSLIMGDVDKFKPYNDIYGHVGGDDCLRKVAGAIVQSAQREGDLIARYGGEEFAVVLPNTDEATAREIAEKIRAAVENLGLPHSGNASGRVTISLGISTRIPPQINDYIDLMQSADEALYRAKEGGRNTIAT